MITQVVLRSLGTTMCPVPTVSTASVETANVDGEMFASFYFYFVVVSF